MMDLYESYKQTQVFNISICHFLIGVSSIRTCKQHFCTCVKCNNSANTSVFAVLFFLIEIFSLMLCEKIRTKANAIFCNTCLWWFVRQTRKITPQTPKYKCNIRVVHIRVWDLMWQLRLIINLSNGKLIDTIMHQENWKITRLEPASYK